MNSQEHKFRPTMKYNIDNMLSWCDFRGLFSWQEALVDKAAPFPSPWLGSYSPKCKNITNVAPEVGKTSQCYNLGMDNSPMMGIWASRGIECTLYFDDWCKSYVLVGDPALKDSRQRLYFDQAQLDTEWGYNNMDDPSDTWQLPGKGFQKTAYKKLGVKSVRCWRTGQAVGLVTREEGEGGADVEQENSDYLQEHGKRLE